MTLPCLQTPSLTPPASLFCNELQCPSSKKFPWPPSLKHLVPSHHNTDFSSQIDRHWWDCWTACPHHCTLSSKNTGPPLISPQPRSVPHIISTYKEFELYKRFNICWIKEWINSGRVETRAQAHPTSQHRTTPAVSTSKRQDHAASKW